IIRRENQDNAKPAVIFNDYMNCLMGDPTEEKETPLIDAAAEAGCDYYCVDSGWYADGDWWDGVGEWLPSEKRFPGGIKKTLDYIREKGMVPGLWLELEVMGINCQLVSRVPPEWFFQRSGKPLIDHGRYQLDFRNPEVRQFADGVVNRLVKDYCVGYIKMDYNINIGQGTGLGADSAAAGLLYHTGAYLDWLDGVFARYPDLVIENCGSGGMRMVYPLLARHSIQSVTDQEDYIKMAAIACNCMTAVPPEQAAIWSYPQAGADEETVIFNMVSAMLFRIHQSGHLVELAKEQQGLVRIGIEVHKRICMDIKSGLPFWPLGLASMNSEFICSGVDCGKRLYLAVWRTRGEGGAVEIRIPLPDGVIKADCAYPPQGANFKMDAGPDGSSLSVKLYPVTARLFECTRFA
ncbi:MAG: alpha-galactosidase, partial [Clostridiales bacterium]|nr:alpha-galactosidase [Clostridiales bacterium]